MKKTTKKNPFDKFTNEQLIEELQKRQADMEALQNKTLNVNGFSAKDIMVQYGFYEDMGYNDMPNFMFFAKHDGKLYDSYYGMTGDWWPKDDEDQNGFGLFIPKGFAEAMENCYEYHSWKNRMEKEEPKANLENALKCLRDHGITDLREFTGEYIKTSED